MLETVKTPVAQYLRVVGVFTIRDEKIKPFEEKGEVEILGASAAAVLGPEPGAKWNELETPSTKLES